MSQRADTIDLPTLSLSVGDGRRIDAAVEPGSVTAGGVLYAPVGEQVEVRLEISRTTTGYAMRLRFGAPVSGPCARCLEESERTIEVDTREVDDFDARDEELTSPYVDELEVLDLAAWTHDALVLAMPSKFLCRPDCAGLCEVCGESLNDSDPAEHRHREGGDPRFAKLRELLE